VLINSKCEVLVTDVYSGYGKATRVVNESRLLRSRIPIENAFCNAHARRYFYKSRTAYKEAEFYLDRYHLIYELNSRSKGQTESTVLGLRAEMTPHFEAIRVQASAEASMYSSQSKYGKALSYFLGNYDGLTLFLTDAGVPIDNNSQERCFRSHVVGRKTWYGTHSERGAKTAAVLFSIIETCKLNQVNPREYFKNLVKDLLAGKNAYTPRDFKDFPKS
jgi:transposase